MSLQHNTTWSILLLGAWIWAATACGPEYAPDPEIPAPYPEPATYAPRAQLDDEIAAADEDAQLAEDDPEPLPEHSVALDPYGDWVDDPEWGMVWIPDVVVVGEDFVPYRTAGHWAADVNDEWVWVSDYGWGYIPFHYGRWVWLGELGVWAWVPGRVYAPAWVVWRVGEPGYPYVGWAPMPPSWCWYGSAVTVCHGYPLLAFWFVPSAYIFHAHWHRYLVPPHHVHVIARHTHVYHAHYRHRPARTHRVATARAMYRPTSPSFQAARVPVDARPARADRIKAVPRPRATTSPPRRVPYARPPSKRLPHATPAPTRPPTRKRVTPPKRTTPRKVTPPKRTTPRKKVTPPKRTPRKKVTPPKRTPRKKVTPRKRTPRKKVTPRKRTPRKKVTPRRRAPPRRKATPRRSPRRRVTPRRR
jgi:hypothetical protein